MMIVYNDHVLFLHLLISSTLLLQSFAWYHLWHRFGGMCVSYSQVDENDLKSLFCDWMARACLETPTRSLYLKGRGLQCFTRLWLSWRSQQVISYSDVHFKINGLTLWNGTMVTNTITHEYKWAHWILTGLSFPVKPDLSNSKPV